MASKICSSTTSYPKWLVDSSKAVVLLFGLYFYVCLHWFVFVLGHLRWTIRIYHKCEDRIEKSFPRIAVWHHEACRVMANGDPEGRIFPEVHEYAKMQFRMMTLLDVLGKIA